MLFSFLLQVGLEEFNKEFAPGSAAKFEFDFRKLLSIQWWLQHLSDAYAENPLHMVTESILIIFIIYLLFRSEKPIHNKKNEKISIREEEELIKEWKPEPLVPLEHNETNNIINSGNNEIYCINTGNNNSIIKDFNNKEYIHLCSHNYLGMSNHEQIKKKCKEIICKYAVGSCGPRGFYGTMDIHINLETRLAQYFNKNNNNPNYQVNAIIYPDYMGCNASVITAFAKRGDLLLIDEGCHYLITQGALLSRSNVIWYPHNDMKALESYLQTVQEEDERHNRLTSSEINRRFIITEGLFHHYGDICLLNDIIRLKNEYKYRLILDDSHALGVLHEYGSMGYWNINISNIDIYISSMDTSLGSTGAFVIGNHEVTYHQTLSGPGYVFTASSPPFQCIAVDEALNILETNEGKNNIDILQSNSKYMRKLLLNDNNNNNNNKWYLNDLNHNHINDISPLIMLKLNNQYHNYQYQDMNIIFNHICLLSQQDGILIYPNAYLPQEFNIPEKCNPIPCLRICINCLHNKTQLNQSATIIKNNLNRVLNAFHNNSLINLISKKNNNNNSLIKKNLKKNNKKSNINHLKQDEDEDQEEEEEEHEETQGNNNNQLLNPEDGDEEDNDFKQNQHEDD